MVCTSPYSVEMQENTDQKKTRIWTLFMQFIFIQESLQAKYNSEQFIL